MNKAHAPRVLITGKNGQVGRELVARAEELAIDFVAFDSRELDICNRAAVLLAAERHQPTVIINAAAYTAVDKAEGEQELAYAVNRNGVENLALACKAQDIQLIHISTDYVFNGEKNSPYVESDGPDPIGVYGASKYAGEEVLKATLEKHIILRVSWIFGRYGNNFVKTMLRLAAERDELSVVNDQFGAPTSARDIAVRIYDLVEKGERAQGVVHLESSPGVSWYEFSGQIFKSATELGLLDKAPRLKAVSSSEFPTLVQRPKNSKLATERSVCSAVEWLPRLEEMLQSS